MKPKEYNAFYCYDSKLSTHLRQKGFTCLTIAKNSKTGNLFSLYIRDTDLEKELEKYNNTLKK